MTSVQKLMNLNKFGIKLGLENMQIMLNYCQNIHNDLEIIHVAGTNGKGSTSTMLAKMLSLSGKKVAVYNSPYVTKLNENYRINDEQISDVDLEKYAKIALNIRTKTNVKATHYEICTLMMILWAYEEKVDYLILEVGLGGRYDATNIVTPILSIITNVSLDHEQILGDTLAKIAFEKCGIIKNNVPVLIGQNIFELVECTKTITDDYMICEELISNIELDFQTFKTKVVIDEKKFILNLFGYHQAYNLAICYQASKILKIEQIYFEKMIEIVKWPYRFEVVNNNPLCILDGAHNEAAMLELKKILNHYQPEQIQVIFSALKDKDIVKMSNILKTLTKNIIITGLNSVDTERGLSALELQEVVQLKNATIIEDYEVAFDKISNKYAVNVVCGSFKVLELYKKYEKSKVGSTNDIS